MAGAANLSIKPAAIPSVIIGCALLGVGFGLFGYCPGTRLACAAAGRFDALVSVIGVALGALCLILIYSSVVGPLDKIANNARFWLDLSQVNNRSASAAS